MGSDAFTVRFDNSLRADLRRRLEATRWCDAVTMDLAIWNG